jgi:phosphoglycerate kinase
VATSQSVSNFRQANLRNKRVLVRVDFNVPIDDGQIRDDTRITAALPTIKGLIEADNAVILVSHLGRPKGKVDGKYSLAPIAKHLAALVPAEVIMASDVVGPDAQAKAAELQRGQILVLENVRFEPGEERNDPDLASALAGLADAYVNDAFGAAHRAHASTVGVTSYLPASAGDLMSAEIAALSQLITSPRAGFVAIIGGAKVTDKIGVLKNLVGKVETLIIGGGMANTFLLESGLQIGTSLAEPEARDLVREIRAAAVTSRSQVVLPTDAVVAKTIDAESGDVVPIANVSASQAIFDVGPESQRRFAEAIAAARTIFWNGPMGAFENPAFAAGTKAVAQAVAAADAFSVVGGGDSVAAIVQSGLAGSISHISTGGGASLEFVEGRILPGIAALQRAAQV